MFNSGLGIGWAEDRIQKKKRPVGPHAQRIVRGKNYKWVTDDAVTILANLGQLCRVGGIESLLPSSPRSKEGLTQLELE